MSDYCGAVVRKITGDAGCVLPSFHAGPHLARTDVKELIAHQYPGNERWGIHTSNPHTNCWCAQQQEAVRQELVRMVGPAAADHLLADQNLRIELRDETLG